MRIKVGIFFGGPSREREISFAGGRTVYDNLDQALFEPVPIFVDSFRKWYLLDWAYLYRGTIRDFFPPVADAPRSAFGFQVYQESLGPQSELELEAMGRKIGRRIRRHELPELIDVAFLALHGEYGEDGQLQRELEYAGVPYTGSGVRASEIGMDKALQKDLMAARGFASPALHVIPAGDFDGERVDDHFAVCEREIGWPMVVRPARQGSSIGVAILERVDGREGFTRAVNAAFFRELLPLSEYAARDEYERLEYVRLVSDLRDGIAFPMDATLGERTVTLYTPDELHAFLEQAVAANSPAQSLLLTGHQSEEKVIVEGFIDGKEFSTIVVRTDEGEVVALPPTEIVKPASELFDYRSKYMPGRSRKVTPIDLPTERIDAIRAECERLFTELGFQVYARIDGFHTATGEIYLNDPNTTSGMMPSSFFFHQAAEIGLNPSQFLTFIVRQSLRARAGGGAPAAGGGETDGTMPVAATLGGQLDAALLEQRSAADRKERIAVLLGGPGFERHISVESGRNVYEKLASSEGYRPVPVFLSADQAGGTDAPAYRLHQLPVNLLLKDNADDIRDKLAKSAEHPVIGAIRRACAGITARYADPGVVFAPRALSWDELAGVADGVFIAVHGRPGEDGQVQAELEARKLYYNGSGIESSQVTIDKYRTLRLLHDAGLPVAHQWLAGAADYFADEEAFYARVEAEFGYPHIAKPVDDGCSSAVKLIKNRQELTAYCRLTFVTTAPDRAANRRLMKLTAKDEWPVGKGSILFETAVRAEDAVHFLEITGGMLTHYGVDGVVRYEQFEPSETLAGGEVLSLEEKFLAGEGQNLTPARLGTDDYSYDYVAGQVKADLERAARACAVEGYCRIDAFVRVFADGRVETLPIEINSLPGMTPATAIFHQAALAGYRPAEFIGRILAYGRARRDRGYPAVARVAGATPADQPPAVPAVSTAVAAPPRVSDRVRLNDPAPAAARRVAAAAPLSSAPATVSSAMLTDERPPEPAHTPEATAYPGTATTFKERAQDKARGLWRFLTAGYFWKNVLAALLFFALCFFLLRLALSVYTDHGDSTPLPDFVGMPRTEAAAVADDLGLKIKFEKGAFDPNRPAGLVVLQHPKAGAGVKTNRSVYLTVLSDEAPMIQLPGLIGNYDYTQYTNRLEKTADIRSKIREQVYDPKQEENTIVHFFYGDRKITDEDLKAGVQVPQGAELEFVVTVRQTGEVAVPDLKCVRFGVAEFRLDGSDLLVGEVFGDVSDRSEAFVVRTEPPGGRMVPVGSKFDIYLSQRRPDGCD